MIPNIVKGRGITGALAYVMGQGEDENGKRIELVPGEKSRADILGAQNIGFEIESAADLDLARRMMEWNGKEENQASKWRKCEKDCLHASLSWEPGQNPTRDEMIAAAQGFLKELGMETAQAIFVAHDDTAHKHLHIVASRIDPLTGKTFSQADDFTKAQAWGLTYEREHGQIPQNESRRALHRIVDAIEARDGAGVVEALTERVPTFTARELDKALSYGRLSKEERGTFRDEILASNQRHRLARDRAIRRSAATRRARPWRRNWRYSATPARLPTTGATELNAARIDKASAAFTLKPEQDTALRHLTQGEGFAMLWGEAGTGKSHTLNATRAAYEFGR